MWVPFGCGMHLTTLKAEYFPSDMDAVWSIKANAKVAKYNGHPELKERALFQRSVQTLPRKMHDALNGKPELLAAVPQGNARYRMVAYKLTRIPIPSTKKYAAPSFEMDQSPPCPPAGTTKSSVASSHSLSSRIWSYCPRHHRAIV
jgi:hypothetical protein